MCGEEHGRAYRERNKRVLEQWERFHRQEPVDESAVRPPDPGAHGSAAAFRGSGRTTPQKCVLSPAALEKLLDRNADLVAVAKSIMEKLYNPISTSRSFISCPTRRIVLHALWDNTGSYPIPHLAPGNLAAESASGTNAIGTCLVEHTPVGDAGFEHYCRSFHGWFCSAAPSGTAGTPSSACSM